MNTDELKKMPEESERQYIWRLASGMENGLYELNWPMLTDVLNRELHDDAPLAESTYRKAYSAAKAYLADVFLPMFSERGADETIRDQIRDLKKERMKVQTEKLELNRWLRENARDEMIVQQLVNAINSLEPLTPPAPSFAADGDKGYCLMFGDEHVGAEFEIRGLNGEILNAYSPEIFEERMWKLLNEVIYIIQKEGISTLHVFNLGDFTDGVLRVGQLMKLRYGVVEGTVYYMEFLANWLNELTRYVRVKFQMTWGNHSELRFFNQPKSSFKNENMGLVVSSYLKARLENNPNFAYIENPTGLIYADVVGFNVLGIHGEVKNMEKAIRDFSALYGVRIDFLCGGHLHHAISENVGINQDVIRVPSIVGIDDYSMSLMKASNPGATLAVLDSKNGLSVEYRIKL